MMLFSSSIILGKFSGFFLDCSTVFGQPGACTGTDAFLLCVFFSKIERLSPCCFPRLSQRIHNYLIFNVTNRLPLILFYWLIYLAKNKLLMLRIVKKFSISNTTSKLSGRKKMSKTSRNWIIVLGLELIVWICPTPKKLDS